LLKQKAELSQNLSQQKDKTVPSKVSKKPVTSSQKSQTLSSSSQSSQVPLTQTTQVPLEPTTTTTSSTTEQPQQEPHKLKIFVSFFELLGKNAYDLLCEKKPIAILEDRFGDIQLAGIEERQVSSSHPSFPLPLPSLSLSPCFSLFISFSL
jgi:hypothetical protein